MNKISLLSILLAMILLLAIPATAATPFALGGKFGLNIASASYDPDIPSQISKSARTGFGFGAVAELGVGGPVFVSAELMYIQKGSKIEGPIYRTANGQVVNGTSTSKLSFLEIPLLVKAKILLKGPVKPVFFAGPTIGFTLTSKSADEPQGYPSQETDEKDNTSSTDFGLTFGGGAEFKVASKIAVTGDLRYALGLTDLAKAQPNEQTHTKIKSSGLQFYFGVLVTL